MQLVIRYLSLRGGALFAITTTTRSITGFVRRKKMLSPTPLQRTALELCVLAMIVSVSEEGESSVGRALRLSFSVSRAVVGYVAPILLRGALSVATHWLSASLHSPCNGGNDRAS